MKHNILTMCLAFATLVCCNLSAVAFPLDPVEKAEIDLKVEKLLHKMTLEEKVGQMRIFHRILGVKMGPNDSLELSDDVKQRLTKGIAGIKNPGEFLSPEKAALLNNKLQKYIIENSRLGIPALFITEAYNGVDATGTTRFGRPMNMAATFNPSLVKEVWDTIGREARLRGLHACHSPEADIMRDPRFGRMSEAYSEDTHLTTEMVVAAVQGVQGDFKGLKSTHIGAVTKHFAGYGQVEGGLNFASVQMSERTLIDEIYPPFKAAVERAHTIGIMASHGDINGIASHANPVLLKDILRDQWGFDGYVVSDSNDIARLHFFMGVAQDGDEAALLGLKAGVDIDLYSEIAYSRLPRLAKSHPEIMPHIDQAVRNVLKVKFILGLFDQPYIDVKTVAAQVRNEKSLALARRADEESVILLKNKNAILPLKNLKGKTVSIIGPVLDDDTAKHFRDVLGSDIKVVSEQGFELTDRDKFEPSLRSDDENKPGFDKAIEAAKRGDIVVLYLGGDEFTSKEAYFKKGLGDRAHIDPVGLQDALVTEVKKLGKPTIVVLKHRRTLSINVISQQADAILDTWDLSEQGDITVAKILIGEVNPSGKLPVTVPRHIGQHPFHYSQKAINYKKDYMFVRGGPLYPFGYGLSYTNFDYGKIKIANKKVKNGDSTKVSVRVKNSGKIDGKEVVQLYIQDKVGSTIRPRKELKAFEKVFLKAGQSKTIEFTIRPEMLAFTGLDMKTKVEAGEFAVEIGSSSDDTQSVDFVVVD